MIRAVLLIIVLVSIVLVSGCKPYVDDDELGIEWIYDAVPTEDAITAIEQGDFRFRGVYSYSLIVPNVKMKCIDIDTDVFPIEGTSDASSTYEERKFNALAMIYADVYNLQIKSHLEAIGEYSCD